MLWGCGVPTAAVCSNLSIARVRAATFSPLVVEVCCLVCVDSSVMLIVAS